MTEIDCEETKKANERFDFTAKEQILFLLDRMT